MEKKTKICRKCGIEKDFDAFRLNDGRSNYNCVDCYLNDKKKCKNCLIIKSYDSFVAMDRYTCKKCNNEKYRASKLNYYYDNKERCLEQQKEYLSIDENKQKRKNYEKKYYLKNRDELLNKAKEYRSTPDVKNKRAEAQRKFNEKTGYQKKYKEEHKEELAKKANIRRKKKYEEDINYKLRSLVSRSIWGALKKNQSRKDGSIMDYLNFQ